MQTNKYELNNSLFKFYDLVNKVKELFEIQLKNKNLLFTNNVSQEIFINADYNMIFLVMRNLVSNAIKFTSNGGNIIIDINKQVGETIISVKDNGIGMDAENLDTIFNEIHKTKLGTNNEKGMGLGLALCKEIIDKHKGKIWVESEKNVGSTFYFSIPDLN